MASKRQHGTTATSYKYNIRDWLTEIVHPQFTQNLYYTSGAGTPSFSGNISSMTWKSGAASEPLRGYKFSYDGLSRLVSSTYGEGAAISSATRQFSENITSYDKNGGIKSLQRYGKTSSTAYGIVDNLTFAYNGNQLKYVNDAVSAPLFNGVFNFVDGSKSTGSEYLYDATGNLTQDFNKKIAKIQYNILNLPYTLQFSNGNTTSYLYGADGIKRKVTHQTAVANVTVPMGSTLVLAGNQVAQTITTDYCSNVIYENGVLGKILTPEGYVTLSGTTATYHYYIKDHQGNNRLVVNGSTIEQVNHYYPFGGLFAEGLDTSKQAYKYNGKELDRMHGLDWYDYEARMMDGALGRFASVDPLCEKYYSIGSYVYCSNNPINRIDPDGKTDYTINTHGQIKIKGIQNNNVDRLFGGDKHICVADRKLLPGLAVNRTGEINKERMYQATANLGDAATVFKFTADNTNVEWKLDVYKGDKGKFAVIATNKNTYNVSITSNYDETKNKTQVIDIHSHPSGGTKGGSDSDMATKAASNSDIKSAVYIKDNSTLYEYFSAKSNINNVQIESEFELLKYINK